MGVARELGGSGSAISRDLWHDQSAAFADVSGVVLDETSLTIITEGVRSFNPGKLPSSTISQAELEAGKAGISVCNDIILYYAYLRGGNFALPVQKEGVRSKLKEMSDQQVFALVLLFFGRPDAYAQYISSYPNIFDKRHEQ